MVDYIVTGKDKFELNLIEQELQDWKAAAQSSIAPSKMFHVITTFGYDNQCGKKTAFKAALSASPQDLKMYGGDEKLYDVKFERLLPSCDSERYGLFITEPFKRYDTWYVAAFPRWQKEGDEGGGARMRSLALQLSSAGIFVTTQKSFTADRASNAASALVLMKVE